MFRGGSGCGFDVRMIPITSCLLLSVFPGMKVVSIAHRMSGFGEKGHEWVNGESAITLALADVLTVFNSICQWSEKGQIPQMDEENCRGELSVLYMRVQQEYRLVGRRGSEILSFVRTRSSRT